MSKDLSAMSDEELVAYIEHCDTMSIQNKILQESLKVICNGEYGASGAPWYRFYNVFMAEAVTLSGQSTIDAAQVFFTETLNQMTGIEKDRIAFVDTDSCGLIMTDVVNKLKPHMPDSSDTEVIKFLDRLGNTKFQDVMDKGFDELQRKQNAFKDALTMKREKICNLITVAKKRYIAKTYVNEDVWYTDPDISITGLESQRSDIPAVCRKWLEEAYGLLFEMDEQKVQSFIEAKKVEFMKIPVTEISVPKGVNDIEKYMVVGGKYRSGTTQQAKAAIIFNRLIMEHKVADKYPPIKSGDKIRILPLKTPNPIREEVLGFSYILPKEFQIDRYVDKLAIFEKTFKEPMNRVMESIGWTADKKFSLDDFF